MKQNIDLIDEIVASGGIIDAHLRLPVDEIIVHNKNKKLQTYIGLKTEFRRYQTYHDENGKIDKHSFECQWFNKENSYDVDNSAYYDELEQDLERMEA